MSLKIKILERITAAPWPERLPSWGLALVFIWAGMAKLSDVRSFARVISQYNLAPDWALAPLALGMPLLEILAGLGLILGVRGSLGIITGMLLMFAGVLWFGILQGLSVDCGCFSAAEQAEHDGLRWALTRDLVMLGAAAFLYWRRWRRQRPLLEAMPAPGLDFDSGTT